VKSPKDWTAWEARTMQQHWIAAGGAADAPESPTGQWLAYGQLADMQRQYEAGGNKPWQLFAAIHVCACHELPLPKWVVAVYSEGWARLQRFDVRTLAAAFGGEPLKDSKRAAVVKRRELAPRVFMRAVQLHEDANWAIDDALWDQLGKELHIAPSAARDSYYLMKKVLSKTRKLQKRQRNNKPQKPQRGKKLPGTLAKFSEIQS
jgi:hypothetical protein